MFKGRVFLDKAEEAEVALCAQCVGLCTPFPSKLARRGQKVVLWQGLMAG